MSVIRRRIENLEKRGGDGSRMLLVRHWQDGHHDVIDMYDETGQAVDVPDGVRLVHMAWGTPDDYVTTGDMLGRDWNAL